MKQKKVNASALSWWGERWLFYADALGIGPSTSGQLQSARRAVCEISTMRGQVRAVVQIGNYGSFATVVLKVKPLSDRAWRHALDAIAAQPETAYRMLNGNFGSDLEQTLDEVGLALFPDHARIGRPIRCSCQERFGCRHENALVLHGAVYFDPNPFLWLEVLGQPREAILAGLRARLTDKGLVGTQSSEVALTREVVQSDQDLVAERFWRTDCDPDQIAVRPGSAAVPDALLRVLGPLPIARDLDAVVHRLVIQIGASATALARGAMQTQYLPSPLEGKQIAGGIRLIPELCEVVRKAETLLSFHELRALCPTAQVMDDHLYRSALSEVSQHLPPDLVLLAQAYVGPRSAVLVGARFSHVVTFDEWYSGQLSLDADWAQAVAIVSGSSPYRIMVGQHAHTVKTLGKALSLEVGDELNLTVVDPIQAVMSTSVTKREARNISEKSRPSQMAALSLLRFLGETGRHSVPEQEGLGVLLGERRYKEPICPDPVWLLPLFAQGLYHQGPLRIITTRFSAWVSTFGVATYGYWNEQMALQRFQVALKERGVTRPEAQTATACVTWWCRYCRTAQDTVDGLPPMGALLSFLWLVVPSEIAKHRVALERVPEFLALWFAVLSEGHSALEKAYRPYIAACGLGDAFTFRTRSLMEGGTGQQVWEVEGCRWIGPTHYFAPIKYPRRG